MRRWVSVCLVLGLSSVARAAGFSDGVSDDRLSLPAGPGSLEGVGDNAEVNANMGAMQERVPFQLPEGFPGATPQLGLSYSSAAGSSIVGIGWSLDIPYIERMTARGLPVYSADDRFAADGSDQLVRVSSDGTTAVYRARFEGGFVRWLWHTPGAAGYWEAQYPDGSRGFFGADRAGTTVAASRVLGAGEGTFRYHLVETVDVHGHVVRYDYTQTSAGYALLDQVSWVFSGADPRYSVKLGYETRSDILSDASAGREIRLDQRLRTVDVRYHGESGIEQIRSYLLTYDDANGLSQLVQVQTFGLGDTGRTKPYPIVQKYTYSQSIGAAQGSLVQVSGALTGATIANGQAQMIDLNGDGLPDVVTSSGSNHQIWLAELASDGTQKLVGPTSSGVTSASFPLNSAKVTELDVNGDGFTDLVNQDTGQVLLNDGSGDWSGSTTLGAGMPVLSGAMRFFDADGDRKIDILESSGGTTRLYLNQDGKSFAEASGVDQLGVDFGTGNVQMSDVNGDGLLDVVVVQSDRLQYKLSLGRGHFAEWRYVYFTLPSQSDLSQVMIDDINGDSLSDLVIVSGNVVSYMLNHNGETFGQMQTASAGASIPDRTGKTVVTADMNGNGSTDIVWIDNTTGQVTYLDLFQQRPNLLTTIENGIGHVQQIAYVSTVTQLARAREAGTPWKYRVPFAATVVDEIVDSDNLTHVEQRTRYSYRDGFYDGAEKQYRGHAHVEQTLVADEFQEDGLLVQEYEVGANDPYLHGQLVSETSYSAGRLLSQTTHQMEKCPVELEVTPAPALDFPIWWACDKKTQTVISEGTSTPVTTETQTEYDGYGNAVKSSNLGIVAGCAASCSRPADAFGEACGDGCLGDEQYSETSYVPRDKTGGAWILHAPYREVGYGRPGGLASETLTYYDGEPFVGELGALTKGLVSRVTVKASDQEVIATSRTQYDGNGNVVATLDGDGGPDDPTAHRRAYDYDEDGLRLVTAAILFRDAKGTASRLERRVRYEPHFGRPVSATDWVLKQGSTDLSPEKASTYEYDVFGRLTKIHRPDPNTSAPAADATEWFEYELANPASKIISHSPLNGEKVECVDGRGRAYQERTRVAEGRYLVSGFQVFNKQGAVVQSYQPYSGATGDCDMQAPASVRFTKYRYDAAHRVIETTAPDESIYGTASTTSTRYLPFETQEYDASDTDLQSPFANTPTIRRTNGLGLVTAIGRTLAADQSAVMTWVTWDDLGRMEGYLDAAGNRKTQTYDLAGRLLQIQDPNTGLTSFTYDAAGNRLSRTDARGKTARFAYDGANRLVERWDDADRDHTLVTALYDQDPSCPLCSNAAARPASITYPDGKDLNGYDVRNRAIYSGRTIEGVLFETRRTFDDRNLLVSVTYPDGRVVERSYDDAGRLSAIEGVLTGLTYDDQGLVTDLAFANQTHEVRSYDAILRLKSQDLEGASGALQSLRYERDRVGNLTQVEDETPQTPLSLAASFAYDAWHRTAQWKRVEETVDYSFDAVDNILSAKSSLESKSPAHVGDYRYDKTHPNGVIQAGALTMSYDAAGNVQQHGSSQMTWDFLGRLAQADLGNDEQAEYRFGPLQQRVLSVEPHGVNHYVSSDFDVQDGMGVTYVRVGRERVARLVSEDFAPRILTDLAPTDAPDGRITSGDAWIAGRAQSGQSLGLSTPSSPERLLLASARRLLYEEVPTKVYFGHDWLESNTVEVDEQGAVIGRRAFALFGSERGATGDSDRYGFTGQESDATGMLHFSFRQLDGAVGRWVSADPAFQELSGLEAPGQDTTAYAYGANNPANGIDPTGLMFQMTKLLGKGGIPSGARGTHSSSVGSVQNYTARDRTKPNPGSTDAVIRYGRPPEPKVSPNEVRYHAIYKPGREDQFSSGKAYQDAAQLKDEPNESYGLTVSVVHGPFEESTALANPQFGKGGIPQAQIQDKNVTVVGSVPFGFTQEQLQGVIESAYPYGGGGPKKSGN